MNLDTAETDFNNSCNTLVANLKLPPRLDDCRTAAADWRQGLEELNNNAAGLAPETLSISIQPGGPLNELTGLWNTYTSLFLANGDSLPLQYTINRNGEVLSIGLDGAANMFSDSSGCAGLLAVVSQGTLKEDGTSVLVNDYAGVLSCGVAAGDLAILITVAIAVHASTAEIAFVPKPTDQPKPAPAPSPVTPTPPTPSPPPPRNPCFSGRTQVQVQGIERTTRMDELRIGDAVLTADGTYSKIYSFGHKDATAVTNYLQVETKSMNDNDHLLEITWEHLIYAQDKTTQKIHLVAAGDLQVGDYLVKGKQGTSEIVSIRSVQYQGAYSPLTVAGNLLVNGVAASNYVTREWVDKTDLISYQTLHYLQHGATLPLRLYCHLKGGCKDETYDATTGFSPWVQFWYQVEQWQLGLWIALQVVFLLLLLVPASLVVFVGKLTDSASASTMAPHIAAALVGYWLWKKTKHPHSNSNSGKARQN
jgi:hypothetical protein